jgi:hypothetical protein
MSTYRKMPYSTGLPGLDAMLHDLLPGDNLVWEVDAIDEYARFVQPFSDYAAAHTIRIVYFRFADHAPLVTSSAHVDLHQLDPQIGFEKFVNEMVDIIDRTAASSWFVFDCLSGLANAWYSDRMLANFFLVICPYVLQLKSLAYFGLLKRNHSNHATDTIYATAQIILEVYRHQARLYLQPQKVEHRHSTTMYMLHVWDGAAFTPVTNSATTTDIVGRIDQPLLNFTIQRFGVWARSFYEAQTVWSEIQRGKRPPADATPHFERMLRMIITRERPFITLARKYFDLGLLIDIMKRLIGSGLIGGKARGMLLAQRILLRDARRWAPQLEVHDSFFIGSDVFYTYIIQNGCWWLRRKSGSLDDVLERTKEARRRILNGTFLDYIRVQFQEMLEYFGQSPIIVRSSSLLEDNYGNAFSGKYESVFCANQGTPDQRLDEFLTAVRKVYASTMDEDALLYRVHHGLLHEDEQMALLVQRVSGAQYNTHFFPPAAGVAFSYNPYVWDPGIDPHAGMLRLAFGLGTRAVDRVEDDYTRIVALNAPAQRPEASHEDARRYTQRYVDVVDLADNRLTTHTLQDILGDLPVRVRDMFFIKDEVVERRARELRLNGINPWQLTFDPLLVGSDFAATMRDMLDTLQREYGCPVDIEFTVNLPDDGGYRINLVQCRPFKVRIMGTGDLGVVPADIDPALMIMRSDGPIVGQSLATRVDRLIYVAPSVYTQLSEQERYAVARVIGRLTHTPCAALQPVIMLVGPGRWGTSTPAMGVPVTFKEINTASVIVELAVMHKGLVPDVSLGTHFFNDLVEMDMLYFAVFPERSGHAFQEEYFEAADNALARLSPEDAAWAEAIKVIDYTDPAHESGLNLYVDSMKQRGLCYLRTTS